MNRRIMLYSGGADSMALWYMMGKPDGVYVCIGAPYEDAELAAIAQQRDSMPGLHVTIVEGPRIGSLEKVGGRIPLRNALLIATAYAYTEANEIIVGFLKGEVSSDKSQDFVTAMSKLVSVSERVPFRVYAPALDMTKTDLLAWLRRTHADAPLHLAVSCYAGDGKGACGACQACFRGDVARYLSGWSDKLPTMPSQRAGIWKSLRMAGVKRWPEVIMNNYDAWRALRGKR